MGDLTHEEAAPSTQPKRKGKSGVERQEDCVAETDTAPASPEEKVPAEIQPTPISTCPMEVQGGEETAAPAAAAAAAAGASSRADNDAATEGAMAGDDGEKADPYYAPDEDERSDGEEDIDLEAWEAEAAKEVAKELEEIAESQRLSETANKTSREFLLTRAKSYSTFIRKTMSGNGGGDEEEDEEAEQELGSRKRRRSEGDAKGGSRSAKATKGKKKRCMGRSGAASGAGGGGDADVETGPSGDDLRSEAAAKMEKSRAARKADAARGLIKQPALVTGGRMKPYQLEGFRWITTLWENGLSGILGDEMGLGKTIQVIAFLAHLRQMGVYGPFLICVPKMTLISWRTEFLKWTPSIPVLIYHGTAAERAEKRKLLPGNRPATPHTPIVIANYEMLMAKDAPALAVPHWKMLVIDEGHRLKNYNCKLFKDLCRLDSECRLLLSGTPLQNTMRELWALLHFTNPQIFGDYNEFRRSGFDFDGVSGVGGGIDEYTPTGRNVLEETVTSLHEILRPFFLRRDKREVLTHRELPPKREIVVYCGMTNLQRVYLDLYDAPVAGDRRGGRDGDSSGGGDGGLGDGGEQRSRGYKFREVVGDCARQQGIDLRLSNPQMFRRKVCLHPYLMGELTPAARRGMPPLSEENPELLLHTSGKLELLDRLLVRLLEDGHKVLIFSQMTQALDLLGRYIEWRRWKYCRIDGKSGTIEEKAEEVRVFQEDSSVTIFLLSTRAAGLGINLTAADTVVLYDSDWNPTVDAQAQDRCHRLGQTRPVVVYRLITVGSIEVEMLKRQGDKKKLQRMTVDGGCYSRPGQQRPPLTEEELRGYLKDDVESLRNRATNDGADVTISDHELALILDRGLIFAGENAAAAVAATPAAAAAPGRGTAKEGNGGSGECSGAASAAGPHTLSHQGQMFDVLVPVQLPAAA